MKNYIVGLSLLLISTLSFGQGLENFVVEKYYVSNAADSAGSANAGGGTLPSGSITWRFYVDMAPGYTLQAIYGVDAAPAGLSAGDHELRLETSTTFFNNEDRCGKVANDISFNNVDDNSVMLDSWVSVGAAASSRLGIPKDLDDGVGTIVNADGILQNNDPSIGDPLTVEDGFFSGGTAPQAVTLVGITTELDVLDCTSQAGSLISTFNASIASLNGSTGATADNYVLIAQITTDGQLDYEFNIQLGTPLGGTENYVAQNAVGGEILTPSLKGSLNVPNDCPTVSITSPVGGSTFTAGNSVAITANAADTDGPAPSVEFFVDGNSIGTDATAPYEASWTAVAGAHNITAIATDSLGCQTTSAVVNVTVGSVIAPTVSITAPANNSTFVLGDVVQIDVAAADADGTVDSVEFFVDGSKIGSDLSSPYTMMWPTTLGGHTLTAKATDNDGAMATSTPVAITVFDSTAAYAIISSAEPCDEPEFCLPINALVPVDNVIGYDLIVEYDDTKVQPNGVIIVASDLVDPNLVDISFNDDPVNNRIFISLFFNGGAPANTEFNGSGELLCVGFAKTAGFGNNDVAAFTASSLQESYINGVQSKVVNPGDITTSQNAAFTSALEFWKDASPLGYDGTGATTLITNIFGDNLACNSLTGPAVQPDINGEFTYDVNNGSSVNIQRDIDNGTSVQPIINGFDAFLTKRMLISDATFIPSVFAAIAMDVNLDGFVSAGDLSQINQRTVLILGEYRQAWNYDANGTKIGGDSKDWLFVDKSTVSSVPAYLISSNFPFDDLTGYSKSRVPQVPFCLEVPVFNNPVNGCASFDAEEYIGIMLGDVNGSFADVGSGGDFKTSGNVVFDVNNAEFGNGYVDVPVSFFATESVHAIDFAMELKNGVTFQEVITHSTDLTTDDFFNANDNTVRFTSYSLNEQPFGANLLSVRLSGDFDVADLGEVTAYLNGDEVDVEFAKTTGIAGINDELSLNVYPNPATDVLNVVVSEDAIIQLMDISGKEVIAQADVRANVKHEINTQNFASGIYLLKVYNDNFSSVEKVVVAGK